MALYPESPTPQLPYSLDEVWKTVITAFDGQSEQRSQKALFPKYDIALTYNALTSAEFDLLWTFYTARRGAYGAFYFYLPDSLPQARTGLLVGMGDAVTTTFDIPGRNTSSQIIYVNGVKQTSGYSILEGGGNEDSDRVEFTSAPAANYVISCDFAGWMRNRCRFEEDKLTRTQFSYLIYKAGLRLKGLKFI